MLKTPILVVIATLIVGGALVHGAVTQRWSVFTPNPAQTERLHGLEVRYADWQPTLVPTDMPTNERSIATSRRYISTDGHSGVTTIISGIPGSVSTHTPDICYVGSGYKCLRGPKRETLDLPGGSTVTHYIADFEKKTQSKVDRVRIRWAWSTDGTWIAPDNPRWQFAKQLNTVPVLYKLYVATPLAEAEGDSVPEDDTPTKAFVTAAWVQFSTAFGGGK
ncbi:MAG: hypothetical protein C0467_18050 [Planctomycetaceae bacterium]|nr:hypothetical protein [Planctomycetaceae bacterium]